MMENKGFRRSSLNSFQSSSDEDMVEITEATLDFSITDDVPPIDRDMAGGNLRVVFCCTRQGAFTPKLSLNP
ncbi:hypothetical protein FKM82_019034 [Ascaphus truei]